ncbi:MAG: ShlB/FhaC/HecB family hemolysin secretion/activation protein [Zoogloeaceae bacterium]|nr:ShlB/FhaC/HecB family hemolysin secretion/activation protein [Zoogloeaceae bacterium]
MGFPMIGALLIVSAGADAQTAAEIEARQLQRQQEREQALRGRLESSPDVRLLTPPSAGSDRIPDDESPCFRIDRIEFSGFDRDRIQLPAHVTRTSDPAVGRCLGTQGITEITRRVQNALIARGLITTRVLAQPQDLTSGTLTLTIVPGRVRSVHYSDDRSGRIRIATAMPARPGDLLNLRDIEQGLENLRRLSSGDADIRIEPGEAPGESDIIIERQQNFPLRLSLALDDSGSRSTGKYMGAASLAWDNPLGLGDLFHASHIHDLGGGDRGRRGTKGHSLHYSVPFGYWLLGLNASTHDYHQTVAGIVQDYRYSGTSERFELCASRVVQRNATGKTTLSLSTWLRKSRNYIDDTEILVQRRRSAGWEAAIAHRAFLGTITLDLEANWRHGTGAFDARYGDGVSRPRILTTRASLGVPFKLGGSRLRYQTDLRAQRAYSRLLQQDQFSIGGRHTVRGFDGEQVLSGERGWFLRNELTVALGNSGQSAFIGLDHGRTGGDATASQPGRRLTGAVIGLRGSWRVLQYEVFTGRPISRPDSFRTGSSASGFNLVWTF